MAAREQLNFNLNELNLEQVKRRPFIRFAHSVHTLTLKFDGYLEESTVEREESGGRRNL